MQKKILVDSSIWIDFFKYKKSKPGDILQNLLEEENVATTGIIVAEILYGIKNAQEKKLVKDYLLALPFFESTREIWISTGDLAQKLSSQGLNIPISDILISTISIHYNGYIFTSDNHFKSIPGIKSGSLKIKTGSGLNI
ncbi:MAG: PIN domain-containing protein [Acidobacteriota bacterium]